MPVPRRAPRHLDRLATLAERGDLALRVRLLTDEHDTGYLTHLAGRFLLGGTGTALGLMSAILLAAGRGPRISGDTALLDLPGYLGLFAGIALLLRVVLDTLGKTGHEPGRSAAGRPRAAPSAALRPPCARARRRASTQAAADGARTAP